MGKVRLVLTACMDTGRIRLTKNILYPVNSQYLAPTSGAQGINKYAEKYSSLFLPIFRCWVEIRKYNFFLIFTEISGSQHKFYYDLTL